MKLFTEILHHLRVVFSRTTGNIYGQSHAKYQVVYPEPPPFNRSVAMHYNVACNYASIGKGDVVLKGTDKVVRSYRK